MILLISKIWLIRKSSGKMNKIYLGIDGKIELLLISVNVDKIKKDLNNWIKIMNGRKKIVIYISFDASKSKFTIWINK